MVHPVTEWLKYSPSTTEVPSSHLGHYVKFVMDESESKAGLSLEFYYFLRNKFRAITFSIITKGGSPGELSEELVT